MAPPTMSNDSTFGKWLRQRQDQRKDTQTNILGVEEKLRKNKENIETIDSKVARILIPHDSDRKMGEGRLCSVFFGIYFKRQWK